MTPEGGQEYWALINSDSDLNIIHQSLIKKWRINFDWEPKGHPFTINEEKLFDYGIYNLEMHAYNHDRQINIYCRFFHAAEISRVDIILGYPWLHAVNPGIDWKEQVWWYPINLKQISIISPEEFTLKMKKVRQVFTVMLFSLTKADQSTQVMLPRKLADFQNVIATEKESISFLHETAVHHIDTENQKIPYKSLYNLSPHELKILCKYLNDVLIKN